MNKATGQADALDFVERNAAGSIENKFSAMRNLGNAEGEHAVDRAAGMLADVRIKETFALDTLMSAGKHRDVVVSAADGAVP
jgi:hypothetical protein